jgi:hypothetical protein
MASSIRTASQTPELQPMFDVSALLQGLLQAQQSQLDALLAWQHAFVSVNQELWDEWVCRWGGGVPIDA